MRLSRFLTLLSVFILAATFAAAANLYSVGLSLVPARPYVLEPFELVIEVEASPGSDIAIAELSGLPVGKNLEIGQFSHEVKSISLASGEERALHVFKVPAKASKAFSFKPDMMARLMVTERVNRGFSTSWNSVSRDMHVTTDDFTVRSLPLDGRPEDFAGAVGHFELDFEATPAEVVPNDIVTLKLTLHGHGNLCGATPSIPKIDETLFKVYPPSVDRSDDGTSVVVTQSVIPLSTNAVTVGASSFSFFDPSANVYTNCISRPVALTFVSERKSTAPAVREVVVDTGAKTKQDKGVDVSKYIHLARGGSAFDLEKNAVMRIAPGNTAKVIVELPVGTQVVPLEASRGFLRVRAKGRTGWIAVQE